MILEPTEIKSVTVSIVSPSIRLEVMGPDAMIVVFWMLSFKTAFFHSSFLPSSRGSLVPLHFLPLEWYHLHIWSCWYFSWQSWFQFVIHPAWHYAWCTVHISSINRVTIYSLDILLSQFWSRIDFAYWNLHTELFQPENLNIKPRQAAKRFAVDWGGKG